MGVPQLPRRGPLQQQQQLPPTIDAHRERGGEEGAPHRPPQKTLKTLVKKIQYSTKIVEPPWIFSQPQDPLKKI